MDRGSWVQCDSQSDMRARLRSTDNWVFDELMTNDANTWGYLTLNSEALKKKNICIPIGFADIGLLPETLLHNGMAYIGITDTVAGYEITKGSLVFRYRVPTVFHQFVVSELEGIIIQDETGFIRLSGDGNQRWIKLCSDTIDAYHVRGNVIFGETMEGDKFEFSIT